MLHVAIGTVVEKAFDAVAVIVLFALGFGVVAVAAALVIGALLGGLWKLTFLAKVVSGRPTFQRHAFRSLLRGAAPFLLYAVLGAVYYRVDAVLLSKLTTIAVVGWYGAAQRLFDTLVFLPTIVSATVMLPLLSTLSLRSSTELRLALAKGLDAMLILGVPIAVGLFALAESIVAVIYGGSAFAGTVPALRWLAPGLLALYVNSILMVTIVAVNRERRLVLLAALCCVLNVGLNLLLIPSFAHVAAAAVKTATEVFICGFLIAALPRELFAKNTVVVFAKALLAGAAMFVTLTALAGLPLAVLIAAGALSYGAVGLALRLVPMEDLVMISRAIPLIGRQDLPAHETEAA
jgi:O-antigen/teichoic acid export membrane protein